MDADQEAYTRSQAWEGLPLNSQNTIIPRLDTQRVTSAASMCS